MIWRGLALFLAWNAFIGAWVTFLRADDPLANPAWTQANVYEAQAILWFILAALLDRKKQ